MPNGIFGNRLNHGEGLLEPQKPATGLLALGAGNRNPPTGRVWGYNMRAPYAPEDAFFKGRPEVGGMAAEDGSIVINPYSPLDRSERDSVARNEAARLFMRDNKFDLDFEISPNQRAYFDGTEYEGRDNDIRSTLLARALTGDKSAGELTPELLGWANWLRPQLEARK